MMKFLIFFIFSITFIQCNDTFIWTGNNDTYWQNKYNWIPNEIPNIFSSVFIFSNSSIPPYSQLPIQCYYLYNDFILDIYSTTIKLVILENKGIVNLYASTLYLNYTKSIGHLNVVESYVYTNLIVLNNKEIIKGSGYINGQVINNKGILYVMKNRNLTISGYLQELDGTLIFPLHNNQLITTSSLVMAGTIKIYKEYSINNPTNFTIASCQFCNKFYISNHTKLQIYDSHTLGHLYVNNNLHTVNVLLYPSNY